MGILELSNNIFQILTLGVLALLTGRLILQKPNMKILLCFEGAMLCYFLGDVYWTLYFAIKGDFPYYISVADIAYVANYLFLFVFCTIEKQEYGDYEHTKNEKISAVLLAVLSLVGCGICYLLVGGFFWNLMYAVPLAMLGYATAINLHRSKIIPKQRFLYRYHISIVIFIVLNNAMFLVSSMGWNNLYITYDFLVTLNFIYAFYSLAREDKA